MTLHAKKAAEDASKHALVASKQAAGVSKNTFEDLTYVGKSTLGDLTKTAKEAAAKKGIMMKGSQQSDSINSSCESMVAGSCFPGQQQQMSQQQQQAHQYRQSPQQQQHQKQQQHQNQHGSDNSLVSHGGNNGLMAGSGRDFFSSFSNEITGITSSTSSMFSGLFGKSKLIHFVQLNFCSFTFTI